MSEEDDAWTWREVEMILEDLKRDGYQPTDLKSSASDAIPEKEFLLCVKRPEDIIEES